MDCISKGPRRKFREFLARKSCLGGETGLDSKWHFRIEILTEALITFKKRSGNYTKILWREGEKIQLYTEDYRVENFLEFLIWSVTTLLKCDLA